MNNTITQNYAKAFFGEISKHPESAALFGAIEKIGEIFADQEVLTFFSSPVVSSEQKLNVITSVFKEKIPNELFLNLKLLSEKDRLEYLPSIAQAMTKIRNDELGIKMGFIYSAVALDKSEITKLESTIGTKIKSKVSLAFRLEKNMKAGVRIEVDGWTFDDGLDYHELKLTEYLKRS